MSIVVDDKKIIQNRRTVCVTPQTEMLQHPGGDYYELSASSKQTPPTFSPQGANAAVMGSLGGGGSGAGGLNNNNNNNNDNDLDLMGQNGGLNSSERESMPSFGFTQEQVACVCEVRCDVIVLHLNS